MCGLWEAKVTNVQQTSGEIVMYIPVILLMKHSNDSFDPSSRKSVRVLTFHEIFRSHRHDICDGIEKNQEFLKSKFGELRGKQHPNFLS